MQYWLEIYSTYQSLVYIFAMKTVALRWGNVEFTRIGCVELIDVLLCWDKSIYFKTIETSVIVFYHLSHEIDWEWSYSFIKLYSFNLNFIQNIISINLNFRMHFKTFKSVKEMVKMIYWTEKKIWTSLSMIFNSQTKNQTKPIVKIVLNWAWFLWNHLRDESSQGDKSRDADW